MKPVAIFRHHRAEGPGYLADYLDARQIPWKLIRLDQHEAVPADVSAFSGLAFMGGPMSVNDELPWIAPALQLIRDAAAKNVPAIGHCLGGQLIAKAHGGTVGPAPVKEIGWGDVFVADGEAARAWIPGLDRFQSFHWHGEMFEIPRGAMRALSSRHCVNQAFVIGTHVAMQFHVEMTEALIRAWCHGGAREIERSAGSPGVQPADEIQRDLAQRVAALHASADVIYDRWIQALQR